MFTSSFFSDRGVRTMRGSSSVVMSALSVAIAAVMTFSAFSGAIRPTSHAAPTAGVQSAPGPQPTFAGTGLPSLDPDDGKFFGVAGSDSQTLEGVTIVLYVGVPAGGATFSVGIFDGDVGASWDDGSAAFSYRLFKDPLKNGTTAKPLDTITSAQCINDDWYEKSYSTDNDSKAPSGNYFYRLEAGWASGVPVAQFNNFKVRTSGQISVGADQDFGFAAGPQNGGDPVVGSGDPNPGDHNDPGANSYNGQFTYYFYVPAKRPSITFWDGDNDRADDTNDPNTPDTDPDGPGPAVAEGVNPGAPADDSSDADVRVSPSIFYDILDPQSHLFTNNNPSGNREWEQFVIGDAASNPDILVTYELQPGLWRYRAQGMDAHNLNVLRSTYEIYSTTDLPLTVSPAPEVFPDHTLHTHDNQTIYYSHTVKNNGAMDDFSLQSQSAHGWATAIYADSNGNGVLDPGEPEITQTGPMAPGQELPILLELQIPDLPSGATDLATITASSTTEWALQGSATDTTTTNSPPNAILSAPATVPEGTPVVLNASASTDPDGDALQYRWDFEGDGTWDMDWGPDAVVTHTWGDDFVADPVVEVRDGEFTSTATAHVIVYNVAPSAEVTIQLAGDEGVTGGIAYSIHITDPGSDEIDFHMTFGDGTGETSFVDCHPICPDPYPSPDVDPADTVASGTKYYGDNGVFEIHILITDDDGGVWEATYDADIANVIPSVSLKDAGSYTFDEGNGIALEASATDPGSDDLTFAWDFGDGTTATHTFYNDGIGPDPAMSPGGTFPFTAMDTAEHVYGDDGHFTVSLTITDDDGGSVRIERSVDVLNVPPRIDAYDAFAAASFKLRVAGEKWHDVRLSVEGRDGELAGVGVTRYPGSPDDQSATIPLTRISLLSGVRVVLYYTPDDDPVNGQRNGANPVWVVIGLPDGRELRLHHTFNVRHPTTWTWEPGAVMPFLSSGGVTVEATASDPGSDDLTFRFEYGDGSMTEQTIFNNGVSPDPHPSTEVNPITATVRETHTYAPGTYTLIITVMDDDGGVVQVSVSLSF
ncbi:MAG: PKD domain-containing protein [Methanobacteriota archaeon]|nr:MAG: PKD domain-containing protein [Euryarchaeota archaeon]